MTTKMHRAFAAKHNPFIGQDANQTLAKVQAGLKTLNPFDGFLDRVDALSAALAFEQTRSTNATQGA